MHFHIVEIDAKVNLKWGMHEKKKIKNKRKSGKIFFIKLQKMKHDEMK